MKNVKFCFIYVTVENFKQAEIIAELAIKNKLCACANIYPEIHSMFEWEGKVNLEKETVLILKTIESKFQKLEKLISENHTYETPCILKLDISKGNKKFLNWLQSTME
jgi:periplasmic divalent cation tolerance protein